MREGEREIENIVILDIARNICFNKIWGEGTHSLLFRHKLLFNIVSVYVEN